MNVMSTFIDLPKSPPSKQFIFVSFFHIVICFTFIRNKFLIGSEMAAMYIN